MRRGVAVTITAVLVLSLGVAVMVLAMVVLNALGGPDWLVALPWWAPAIGTVAWSIARPRPGVLTDDDDDSWVGYTLRRSIVGTDEPRPVPLRVISALVLGAPACWALVAFLLLELGGLG